MVPKMPFNKQLEEYLKKEKEEEEKRKKQEEVVANPVNQRKENTWLNNADEVFAAISKNLPSNPDALVIPPKGQTQSSSPMFNFFQQLIADPTKIPDTNIPNFLQGLNAIPKINLLGDSFNEYDGIKQSGMHLEKNFADLINQKFNLAKEITDQDGNSQSSYYDPRNDTLTLSADVDSKTALNTIATRNLAKQLDNSGNYWRLQVYALQNMTPEQLAVEKSKYEKQYGGLYAGNKLNDIINREITLNWVKDNLFSTSDGGKQLAKQNPELFIAIQDSNDKLIKQLGDADGMQAVQGFFGQTSDKWKRLALAAAKNQGMRGGIDPDAIFGDEGEQPNSGNANSDQKKGLEWIYTLDDVGNTKPNSPNDPITNPNLAISDAAINDAQTYLDSVLPKYYYATGMQKLDNKKKEISESVENEAFGRNLFDWSAAAAQGFNEAMAMAPNVMNNPLDVKSDAAFLATFIGSTLANKFAYPGSGDSGPSPKSIKELRKLADVDKEKEWLENTDNKYLVSSSQYDTLSSGPNKDFMNDIKKHIDDIEIKIPQYGTPDENEMYKNAYLNYLKGIYNKNRDYYPVNNMFYSNLK